MKILVTGTAGFIASKLVYELSLRDNVIVGIDNINDYYDVHLKYARLKECGINIEDNTCPFGVKIKSDCFPNYTFIRLNLGDRDAINNLFQEEKFDKVVNLAAQAGVRYSITNPYSYVDSNLVGFINILECCRHYGVKLLVYASSSSAYGMNTKTPFSEDDKTDLPVSLYAATKKANELMAHSYSKLYNISTVGLRYFTVYGPYGRPDMAPMLFADAITKGEPVRVFNNGDLCRDFTYIDDVVQATIRIIDAYPKNSADEIPYKIYNIGCSQPVKLMDFIREMENAMGKEAKKVYLPMQPGDVYQTYADTSKLEKEIGYKPTISLKEGVRKFIEWHLSGKNPLNNKSK